MTHLWRRMGQVARSRARDVEPLSVRARQHMLSWLRLPANWQVLGAPALAVALIVLSLLGVSVMVPGLALAQLVARGDVTNAQDASQSSASDSVKLPVSYVDSLLGFSLHLPAGWSAHPEPVIFSRASAVERNALVSLHDPAHAGDTLEVAVTESAAMPGAFARLGTPDTRVGPYPALTRDIPAAQSDASDSGPCAVRIFLAQTSQRADYVVAQACGADIFAHAAAFESIIASYQPATPKTGALTVASDATQDASVSTAQPATCAQLVASASSRPADTSNWGRELTSPTDPRWNPYPTPAASVCSNFYYVNGKLASWDGYTFQCVELANRFLREQWGHGGVNGNAAEWFDYYQNGVRYDGRVRVYPDAQLSDDASQGVSAFAPGPGDILVWQDVQDGKSWTSGLTSSPGHVAVITGTDATHVYFMQQNYNEVHYYMSLPLMQVAAGWKITDTVSGVPGRIVRGWIHFTPDTAAPGPVPEPTIPPTLSTTNAQGLYAIGADGQLYATSQTAPTTGASQAPQLVRVANDQQAPALRGTPSLNVYAQGGHVMQSVYATGVDGQLYEFVGSGNGANGWARNDLTTLAPLPTGVVVTGSPVALTYNQPGLSVLRHTVFAAASDGNVYQWVWNQVGHWQAPTKLPSASAAVPLSLTALLWTPATTAAATPTTNNTSLSTVDEAVYVLRADGHLYEELSADGTAWQETDVSAATAAKSATPPVLTGTPSAYTFTPSGTTDVQRTVFAVGLDKRLYSFSFGPSPSSDGTASQRSAPVWTMTDVSTAAADGPKVGQSTSGSAPGGATFGFVGSPSALYAPAVQQPSQTSHEVFVTGNDGHVYAYAYSDRWHATDVSAAAKVPAATILTGSPLAFSYALTGDTASRRVVYVAAQDGTVAVLSDAPTATSATPAWSFTASSATGTTSPVALGAGQLAGATWTQPASVQSTPTSGSDKQG